MSDHKSGPDSISLSSLKAMFPMKVDCFKFGSASTGPCSIGIVQIWTSICKIDSELFIKCVNMMMRWKRWAWSANTIGSSIFDAL